MTCSPGGLSASNYTFTAGEPAALTINPAPAAPGQPTVSITTPLDGGSLSHMQTARADFGCQDAAGAPGIRSCTGTVANGAAIDTSTVGAHSFTVTATSQDGQQAVKTVHYTVGLPSNHFIISQTKTRTDGQIFVTVEVPGRGRVAILVTALKDNVAKGTIASLLQPATRQFVFARSRNGEPSEHPAHPCQTELEGPPPRCPPPLPHHATTAGHLRARGRATARTSSYGLHIGP